MLRGSFGAHSGEPNIEGYLIVPALNVSGHVEFLVDTGADGTLVQPSDLLALGADEAMLRRLQYKKPVNGIGGSLGVHIAKSSLLFLASSTLNVYSVEVGIPHIDQVPPLPSLLGRDILQHWRMTYDPYQGRLSFVVRYADASKTLRRRPRPSAPRTTMPDSRGATAATKKSGRGTLPGFAMRRR